MLLLLKMSLTARYTLEALNEVGDLEENPSLKNGTCCPIQIETSCVLLNLVKREMGYNRFKERPV